MAKVVIRDVSVTSGHELLFLVASNLVAHGWVVEVWSDGTTRSTNGGLLTSASGLSASMSYVILRHVATGRHITLQRMSQGHIWRAWYTVAGNALTPGDATTPDSHGKTRQVYSCFDRQVYPTNATTNCKLHMVVDDATSSFFAAWRRTPHPGGGAVGYLVAETFANDLSWPENPDPFIIGSGFDDGNNSLVSVFGNQANGWVRYGQSGEAWVDNHSLENPFGSMGGYALPGGVDTEYELRWGCLSGSNARVIGRSSLLRGVIPWQAPTTGLDAGSNWSRAGFGPVTCDNDGTPLES